ncbi:ABC transporter ATP-binding protein [Streptomyces durmitorensis]|uniref:ATP-binding cassette domain-containing protein n=1 Tax=Streptomyces durmitorensis TaxID=319947 RepID=A0ABY4Q060_9ACTN|nr:ATP-binding cassette domain-containing protein [Streptomyces durmitorensis]UQT59461.1 ATP-binding cassette domain-containing protein [Streptomyces durmitorensis]
MRAGIELHDARVRYGPLEALHGVSLAAPSPCLTVLLGRNGSGRTTTLRALAGTAPLTTGTVTWDGTDVTRLTAHERAQRGLCFVPDGQAVFGHLTVAENLELSTPAHNADPDPDPSPSPHAEQDHSPPRADITPALTTYPELRPLLRRRAGTLSGGEQRMLALSRAVLTAQAHARVILIDEPTQGMSPAVASRTYDLLVGLSARACVLTAEQRLPPGLREHASRTAVVVHELRRGAVVFSGEATELNRRWRPCRPSSG